MSTNIHFSATRDVVVVKTGLLTTQEINFQGVWPTSSQVTREIMKGDPIEGYKNWVLSEWSEDEELEVFADDDVFCETPIGTKVYNAGKEHVEAFEAWLTMCDEEGFEVRAEAW